MITTQSIFVYFLYTYNKLENGLLNFMISKIFKIIWKRRLAAKLQRYCLYHGRLRKISLLRARPRSYMAYLNVQRNTFYLHVRGAEDHCHVAALSLANQLIFDWLDNTLREQRS